MLQAFGLSFEPSPLVGKLFQNVNISIGAGEKLVLTGANGSGKTKLLEILAGCVQPGAGRVVYDSRCRMGYVAQDVDLDFDGSLREFLAATRGLENWRDRGLEDCRIGGLEDSRDRGLEDSRDRGLEDWRIGGLEDSRDRGLEDSRDRGLEDSRIGGLEDCGVAQLDESGVGLRRGGLERVLARMGLAPAALDRQYNLLSVGERVRASIGRAQLSEPTLLLLDEPTNHLDRQGREWLVEFLNRSKIACLMVSHDRAVVNAVADRVLLLADGSLTEYAGGYDDMIRTKEQADARIREQYIRQVGEERRVAAAAQRVSENAARMTAKPTGRTYDPKAKAFYAGKEAKIYARAKAIRTRVEQARELRVDKPFEEQAVAISFNTRPLRHSDTLTVRRLAKSYGPRVLFSDLSFTLSKGERLAVVGANGSGKTTLFRILLGEESYEDGEATWSGDASPAYLSQERGALDLDLPVLEALDPVGQQQTQFVRTILARLRMRGDDALKPVRALSVGERTKAELARILMTSANVLLLDEPTNHLDIDSLLALEQALCEFNGSILFTCHDQTFVERVATGMVSLDR